MDIDDVIGSMTEPENLDFDNLRILGDALGIDVDCPPLDDMYPDWEAELRVEVHGELLKAIEFSITGELAKIRSLRQSILNFVDKKVDKKPSLIGNNLLLEWAFRLEQLFKRPSEVSK